MVTIPNFLEIKEQPEWNAISFRRKWKIEDNQWPAWHNKARKLIFPPIKCANDSLIFVIATLITVGEAVFSYTKGI